MEDCVDEVDNTPLITTSEDDATSTVRKCEALSQRVRSALNVHLMRPETCVCTEEELSLFHDIKMLEQVKIGVAQTRAKLKEIGIDSDNLYDGMSLSDDATRAYLLVRGKKDHLGDKYNSRLCEETNLHLCRAANTPCSEYELTMAEIVLVERVQMGILDNLTELVKYLSSEDENKDSQKEEEPNLV